VNYFNALKTFVRLAEVGTFTRVSEELMIKTSTASRHIAELESDLGIALFNRTTRGLTLTEGGRVFYQHSLQVMESLEEAREAASSLNRVPSGVLKFAAPSAFVQQFIAPNLAGFLNAFPQVSVNLVVTNDEPDLIASNLDLAVRTGVLADSSLMARKLTDDWHIACCSPAFIAHQPVPQTLEALSKMPAIVHAQMTNKAWYTQSGKDAEMTAFNLSGAHISLNDEMAMLKLCQNQGGIAYLPTWLAANYCESGQLIQLLPNTVFSQSAKPPAVWAVYPRKKTVSSKVRVFIDFLVKKTGG
jgi:DNA-binding transcriptional LysR family regulator